MRYIKSGLSVLTGLFLFYGCQKSDLIGFDQTQFIEGKSTTLSVKTITEKDSVYTSGLLQHPFGYIADPQIGTTEANLAFALTLPSEGYSFGTNPVIDSAVLVLKYGDEFYGDSTGNSTFNIALHQLNEEYNVSTSYLNSKEWNYQSAVIGSKTLKRFSWGDSLRITQVVKNGPDTLIKVAPQMRLKLDNSFVQNAIINTGSENLASNVAFNRYIKGLYMTLANKNFNENTNPGGIAFFDLSSSGGSKLEVYYRTTNQQNVKDTLLASFPVTYSRAASNIKHTYKTQVTEQLSAASNPLASRATVYLQPLGGLRARIDLDNVLADLKALGNHVAINKAELVVTPIPGTFDNPFKPSPRLTLYRNDIAGQRKPVPDNAIGLDPRYLSESIFGGFFDSSKKQYRFIITSYMQDLVSGDLKEYGTYIAPVNKRLTGNYNINASASTAARVVVGGDERSAYKMKINIIYTKPE